MANNTGFGLKVLLAAVVLAAAGIGVKFYFRPIASVTAVTRGKAIHSIPASVRVRAKQSLEVKPETGGRLKTIADEGQSVKADEVVAQLDDSEIQLQIDTLKNNITAQTDTNTVREGINQRADDAAEEDRKLKERDKNSGRMTEVAYNALVRSIADAHDQRRLQEIEANRQLSDADINLQREQRTQKNMTLTAPFDGTVTDVQVTPGALINGSQTVATLISNSRIVEALISEENFAAGVRVGQKARVNFLGSPDYIDGTVSKILPTPDPQTGRYVVWLDLNVDPVRLQHPGITGEAVITIGEHDNSIIVPRRALYNGQLYVVKNGRVQIHTPETGLVSLDLVEILSGVSPGDEVIVDGQDQFHDGEFVRTQEVKVDPFPL